jgi:DNA/RNA-binding domain of Phe-tRNA-synthetase-like protein
VRDRSESLDAEIEKIVKNVKKELGSPESLKNHPYVRAYRNFLWRLGIDPTKIRPSSEALARRILRGSPLPKINNIVDAGNASSLKHMVPIGLYDLDKLIPPLKLTLCEEECLFEPLGGKPRVLKQGTPVLLDTSGYVLHVYPHRDAAKTAVRVETRRILAISAGVQGVEDESLIKSLEDFARLLEIDGLKPRLTRVRITA